MAGKRALRVGVLALQGAFREHCRAVERCGAEAVPVRRPLDGGMYAGLDSLDGLILPGGESTAIGKLLTDWKLLEPLRRCGQNGMPLYGSCAGLILLCARIQNGGGPDGPPQLSSQPRLGLLDATVRRNAFGRQVDSFARDLAVAGVTDEGPPLRAVFIRAPLLVETGPGVDVLARVPAPAGLGKPDEPQEPEMFDPAEDGLPVAVRQGNLLATSFHPELTDDIRLHACFLDMARAFQR